MASAQFKTNKKAVLATGKCLYCGTPCTPTVDHILPLLVGGTNKKSNLTAACTRCNHTKGSKTIPEFLAMIIKKFKRKHQRYHLRCRQYRVAETNHSKMLLMEEIQDLRKEGRYYLSIIESLLNKTYIMEQELSEKTPAIKIPNSVILSALDDMQREMEQSRSQYEIARRGAKDVLREYRIRKQNYLTALAKSRAIQTWLNEVHEKNMVDLPAGVAFQPFDLSQPFNRVLDPHVCDATQAEPNYRPLTSIK